MFKRNKKKVGIFLVHGFMENGLQTYDYFIKYMKKNTDFIIKAIDLQGHGKNESISDFDYKLCIKQVSKEYKEFKQEVSVVNIVGFSMGGVIASYLAGKFGANKLVLVSPSFRYMEHTQFGKDVYTIFNKSVHSEKFSNFNKFMHLDGNKRKSIVKELITRHFKDEDVIYDDLLDMTISINTLYNFTRLVYELKKKISITDLPVRIYHGEFDELVPISSSLEIFKKIDSKDKRLIVLPKVFHRILCSSIKEDIFKEIKTFFEDHKNQ